MASGWSDAAVQARLTATLTLLDAGTLGAKVLMYTSPRPAEGAAITTQTLLATLVFPAVSFDTWGTDEAVLHEPPDVLCVGNGSVNWARLVDDNNVFLCDVDVGTTGSGAEIEMSDLTVYIGGTLKVTSAKLREV
jgi:hypothetical protein